MSKFPTMQEEIAISLAFEYVGESRYNRSAAEYQAIAAKFPPLKVLHGYINDRLQEIAETGSGPLGLCYFRAGDQRAWIEPYPRSLSLQVVRTALVKSGMRAVRKRRPRNR